MAFPTTILSLADAIGSQFLSVFFGGSVAHSTGINLMKADLIAGLTKLGTGASVPSNNTVLRGNGAGTSAFGQVQNADIVAAAGIPYSKLTLTGAVVNGDLAGSIAYSKLSLAGALLTSDLVAHATSQVIQSIAGFSGTNGSATPANVGTALSITTTGTSDLLWLCTLTVAHNVGGAPRCSLGTKLDAGADANVVRGSCAGAAGETTLVTFGYATGVSAATHTIQPRWANVDASGTFTAFLGNIIAVELKR